MEKSLKKVIGEEVWHEIPTIISYARILWGSSYTRHEEYSAQWTEALLNWQASGHTPAPNLPTGETQHLYTGQARPGFGRFTTLQRWYNPELGREEETRFVVVARHGEAEEQIFNRLMGAIRDKFNLEYERQQGWGQLLTQLVYSPGMFTPYIPNQ